MLRKKGERFIKNLCIVLKYCRLSEDSKVLQLKEGRMVKVSYNPRLGQLIREVQQLSVIGMKIPVKIKEVSDRAVKFMSQAKALEQVKTNR